MSNEKKETFAGCSIYLNRTYFIAYAGGKRDLPAKDMKEYKKILSLPEIPRQKELAVFPKEKNPNYVPIKGVDLLAFIKDLGFVPFFDRFFNETRVIKLTDRAIYESLKNKVYSNATQTIC